MPPHDPQDLIPQDPPEHLEDFDVISTYTAGQAVADGMMVAVTPRDLVTIGLFSHLAEVAPMTGQPPAEWPVPIVAFCKGRAADVIEAIGEENARKVVAAALCVGLIDHHRVQAQRIHVQNIQGGIFTGYVLNDGTRCTGFHVAPDETELEEHFGRRRVWLMPNEMDGITMMFPSEY